MTEYTSDPDILKGLTYEGFFVGWPVTPSPELLLKMLVQSDYRHVAYIPSERRCVGYICGLTDGVMFGYISSLEVLPSYQKAGIGKALVKKLLAEMPRVYGVDLVCDPDVQQFYESCGFQPCSAMVIRRRGALLKI